MRNNAEAVTWVPVTTVTDALGNVVATDGTPVALEAFVGGRPSGESVDPRSPQVLIGLQLYFPRVASTPSASDWFTVRGERYEVEGQAHRWGGMGVEVAVKRAEATP